MAYPPFRSQLVLLFSALALACGHEIGDECTTSVDCSQGGERLCDVTQPGGYCTVFNCEPDTCPEEASCIAFGASLSIVPACQDKSGLSRIERSFCMRSCGSHSDCRGGYRCVDVASADNAWRNALPIDLDRPSKVCLAVFETPESANDEAPDARSLPAPNVCTGAGTGGSSGSSSGGASSGGASSGGASSGGAGGMSVAGAGGAGNEAGSTGEGGSSESAGAGGSSG